MKPKYIDPLRMRWKSQEHYKKKLTFQVKVGKMIHNLQLRDLFLPQSSFTLSSYIVHTCKRTISHPRKTAKGYL